MSINVRHDVYIHFGDDLQSTLVGILLKLNHLTKENETIMTSIAELKAAVAAKATEVRDAITAAIATETAQITAQIQALKDQVANGVVLTQADFDAVLASVSGIGTATTAAIDKISENDGATSQPPPNPVP